MIAYVQNKFPRSPSSKHFLLVLLNVFYGNESLFFPYQKAAIKNVSVVRETQELGNLELRAGISPEHDDKLTQINLFKTGDNLNAFSGR
jgi:hypothetical protein